MRFTKETEYALLGLSTLAEAGHDVVLPVSEIAEARGLPAHYFARVFHKLARQGLVVAKPGPGKGCRLAVPPSSIRLIDIMEAIEGPRALGRCVFWQGHDHERNPCPLHHLMEDVIEKGQRTLEELTLAEFLDGSKAPRVTLDRGCCRPGDGRRPGAVDD